MAVPRSSPARRKIVEQPIRLDDCEVERRKEEERVGTFFGYSRCKRLPTLPTPSSFSWQLPDRIEREGFGVQCIDGPPDEDKGRTVFRIVVDKAGQEAE